MFRFLRQLFGGKKSEEAPPPAEVAEPPQAPGPRPLRPTDASVIQARLQGLGVLVNSMIELGITQAAALQLAVTLPNLVPGGHCFMSTLRLTDDITSFRGLVRRAEVHVPDLPGLGVELDEAALAHHAAEGVTIRSRVRT